MFESVRTVYFWKAVTNHSQAASPLGEHSSVVFNYWLGKGRNYEKLSMHLIKSKHAWNIAQHLESNCVRQNCDNLTMITRLKVHIS